MRTFLKIFVATVFLMVITVAIFFIYSVAQLPHPSFVRQLVEGQKTSQATPSKLTHGDENQAHQNMNSVVQATSEGEQGGHNVKSKNDNDIIMQFISEDFSDIRVCQNLEKIRPEQAKEDYNQTFEEAISHRDRSNPAEESLRVTLKYIFQQDVVKNLILDLDKYKNVPKDERVNLLEKLGFYTRAAQALYDLYRQKSNIEDYANHSYHMFLLTKVIAQKPILAQDKNILDFCYQMQNSIASRNPYSSHEERAEFLKLLEYASLRPEDLDFNPHKYMRFVSSIDKHNFSFGFSDD